VKFAKQLRYVDSLGSACDFLKLTNNTDEWSLRNILNKAYHFLLFSSHSIEKLE